jgi:hypothetical protein
MPIAVLPKVLYLYGGLVWWFGMVVWYGSFVFGSVTDWMVDGGGGGGGEGSRSF